MKRFLLLPAVIFVLSGYVSAQQTVMRSPNGAERWKKGEYQEIKWGCVQCTGTAELHLVRDPQRTMPGGITATRSSYQTLGVIKTAVAVNPNNQFYSFNWKVGDYIGGTAPLGDGYRILVKVMQANGSLMDISDAGFVIGAPPVIDTFAVNDGLDAADQRKVTLNYTFSGHPSPTSYRVRCTPAPGTPGNWTSLAAGTWPTYELPQSPGTYTIEFWLANDFGSSPSRSDSIRYGVPPPPETQDYTVLPASIACRGFPDVNPAWYSWRCTFSSFAKPSAGDCFCTDTGAVVVRTKADAPGLGTKVEYEFFGGRQLNPGWSFVTLSYSDVACKDRAGSAVLVMPQPGSQNILFKVRLWTDGFTLTDPLAVARGIPVCEFRINSLVIRGPAGRNVSEAFQ